ncbi:MAG TPA: PAS domain S-box protein [Methylotenera sp.]|nr:PAS domain S-box protein [Methylotenera sp.]HPV44717.1 PAS domain S-box protein [Methylotenera sp.]
MANPLEELSFLTLFNAAADAMLLLDATGHVIQANSAALLLLEYTEDAICGLEAEALMPFRFREPHRQYRQAFYNKPEKRSMGHGRDLFVLSRSGKELAVDIGLSPIQTKQQLFTLITFYPADKRHQVEQALLASEERLRLAKQAAGFGIFHFDAKHDVIHWDERMRELWGEDSGDSISYEKFVAVINPLDREIRRAALERASDSAGNGEFKVEYRVTNPKDGIERWVSTVGRMHFEDGHATRLIGIARNITERKANEKKLQAQRAETENVFKQQVAARTASAIAHELNQPLGAISAYSEVALHALQSESIDQEKLKRALQGCVDQAHRAGRSLHELLAFLLKGELATEKLDINKIVKEALDIVHSNGYGDFHSVLELEPDIPPVEGNEVQIQKVLVNLLRNSVEAMQNAGMPSSCITIKACTSQISNLVQVTVQDSGPGLNAETAQRIFEPFFTTKSSGIGMGLAISRALVEANGGQLWLDPDFKSGAMFHFTLPFAQ